MSNFPKSSLYCEGMESINQTAPTRTRKGDLPIERHSAFKSDVADGLGDTELARKYNLSERTATNWRLRLVGPRDRHAKGSEIEEGTVLAAGSPLATTAPESTAQHPKSNTTFEEKSA